jgi:hypothetical protein
MTSFKPHTKLGAWAVENSVSKFAYKLIKTEPPTQFLRRL